MQLMVQVLLLACQHPDLLLHGVHLTPDLLCIALKPEQRSSLWTTQLYVLSTAWGDIMEPEPGNL